MSSSPYQPAATLLNQLWEQDSKKANHFKKRKSLKSLVFDEKTGQLKCSKTTYAQVCHVQKHLPALQAVWQKHVNRNHPATIQNEGLLYVLLYELLLGPNLSIRGGGQLKRQLTKEETKLRNFLQQIQSTSGEENTGNADNDSWPRYIRVNTCQTTTQQVVHTLRAILSDSKLKIYLDPHVPDLLVVPAQATPLILGHTQSDSDGDKWNPQTSIVLQDKSSCFPALCLMSLFSTANEQTNRIMSSFELIDACAAPGNKTTHLAALAAEFSKRQSKKCKISIHAFDRDEKRHELLQRRCQALVGEPISIQTKQQDFLTVDPNHYPHVRGILLDPTCSGSGMRDKAQLLKESDEEETKRLEKLSNFQYKALLHACSFPQVEYIVYSTCSVNQEENEDVVQRVLSELSSTWIVLPPPALAHWKRRGQSNEGKGVEGRHNMIRVDPMEDETNGFFVCCLARSCPKAVSHVDASIPRDSVEKQAKALGLSVYTRNTFAAMAKDKEKQQRHVEQAAQPLQTAKKQKKNKADPKAKSTSESLPSKTSDITTSPQKKNEKRNLPDAAPSSPKNAKKARTTNHQGTRTKVISKTIDGTSQDTVTEDKNSKHAKKRAKRLEWKQKQREAKQKRLQVNPK